MLHLRGLLQDESRHEQDETGHRQEGPRKGDPSIGHPDRIGLHGHVIRLWPRTVIHQDQVDHLFRRRDGTTRTVGPSGRSLSGRVEVHGLPGRRKVDPKGAGTDRQVDLEVLGAPWADRYRLVVGMMVPEKRAEYAVS